MRKLFLTLLFAATSLCAQAQTEKVVEIPSRDVKVRALLIQPANPVGSVVLLAGGHGVLALSADGKIGWGGGNQLVRTRMAYARAGFATIVPDAAPDMGTPKSPKNGFRWSAEHGRDIGAVVAYMRKIKEPVAIAGTSDEVFGALESVVHRQAHDICAQCIRHKRGLDRCWVGNNRGAILRAAVKGPRKGKRIPVGVAGSATV
jgi:hypothetical protein